MIAEVIPYARTPRTLTTFDYQIPKGVYVSVGDVVYVPFRNQTLLGLVMRVKKDSEQKVKTIIKTAEYPAWRSEARREWLRWFAEWHAISLTHAFKTLQYPLPKKTVKRATEEIQHTAIAGVVSSAGVTTITASRPVVVRAQKYLDLLAWYTKALTQSTGHTLILCPEHHDASRLHDYLANQGIESTLCLERSTPQFFYTLETQLQQNTRPQIVIGTKKLLNLNLEYFAQCIVDQEESPSHKQSQINPRYHTRRVVHQFWTYAQKYKSSCPQIIFASIAPSVETAFHIQSGTYDAQSLPSTQEPRVRLIDMNEERQQRNFTWFSEEVIDRTRNAHHALLFLNRTGQYSHAVCTQCSTVCSAQDTHCTVCGNAQLRIVHKGIEQLEKEIQSLFPHKNILRIDASVSDAEIEQSRKNADIIVATEKILRHGNLTDFDYIALLSIDHMLAYPHYRSHERVYQLLRTFFSQGVPIDLQTSSPLHPVIQAARKNAYEEFAHAELDVRNMLHYPPYGYRARILYPGSQKTTLISTLPDSLPLDAVLDPEY